MANGGDSHLLLLTKLRTDGGTQPRAAIDQFVVDDYAEQIRGGATFPPVVAFYDGTDYWLGDGFHRWHGYGQAGSKKIPVDVRQGTQRDAVLYSVGANAVHGMRRTNDDKRRAVTTLLNDQEWGKWGDREIARRCAVSHEFVRQLRGTICQPLTDTPRKASRGGTTYTIETKNIGASQRLAPQVREQIRHTRIAENPDHVRKLAALPAPKQAEAAALMLGGKVKTVDQAERAIQRGERRRGLSIDTPVTVSPASDGFDAPEWRIVVGDKVLEMKKLRPKSARVVWADPRYNLGFDYGEGSEADRWPPEQYLDWCREWLAAAAELVADDGSLWVMICDEWADDFGVILKRELGLHRRAWVKWYETFGVNRPNNFNRCGRHLHHFTRHRDPKRSYFNPAAVMRPSSRQVMGDNRADPGGKIHDDVWIVPRIVGNSAERMPDLPTQIPVEVVRRCVESCSEPGDLVVDPCVGSGTTVIVAAATGRRSIGIEVMEATAALAERRVRKELASGFAVTREAFARAEEFNLRYLQSLLGADAAEERKAS